MGRLAAEAIESTKDLELTGAYAPGHAGEVVAGATCVESVASLECDVVVDWTNPDVVLGNLASFAERGFHVVVGTSGFDEPRLAELASVWDGAAGKCLVVPNFSIGAVLMMRFAEVAAPHVQGAEVIELHHDDKPDFPSGTALATASRIAAAGGTNVADPQGRGSNVAGIPVHSIRLPGVIASQEVVFGSAGETLSMRHDTFDRQAFMPGMLTAIKAVPDLPQKLTIGLDTILGI